MTAKKKLEDTKSHLSTYSQQLIDPILWLTDTSVNSDYFWEGTLLSPEVPL